LVVSSRVAVESMKTLDIGKHRRARVWIGELPDTVYPFLKTVTHTVEAEKKYHVELGWRQLKFLCPLALVQSMGCLVDNGALMQQVD
jgi:hypothetical protein